MSNSIGIMQGRLSTPAGKGPQVFPVSTWRKEFSTARELGFTTIEWLIEADSLEVNPLLSAAGRHELKNAESASGVRALSACAHCVLQWKPFEEGGAIRLAPLPVIVVSAGEAGIERLVLPLLEDATISRAASPAQAVEIFRPALRAAEKAGVDLAFEMDRPAQECRDFLARFDSPRARLCYDSGNAVALGFDIVREIPGLLPLVAEIHLKDRQVRGRSHPLGQGETPFAEFFKILQAGAWQGPFVLETPTLADPLGQARANLAFVKNFWP